MSIPCYSYFVPKGVERGRKGYKNRLDFFDSSKQVYIYIYIYIYKHAPVLFDEASTSCVAIYLAYCFVHITNPRLLKNFLAKNVYMKRPWMMPGGKGHSIFFIASC